MSFLWALLLVVLWSWGLVWLRYDSPAVELWRTRNAYRVFIVVLLVALVLMLWKAATWHEELVKVISGCH